VTEITSDNVCFTKGLSRVEAAAWVYLNTDLTQTESAKLFNLHESNSAVSKKAKLLKRMEGLQEFTQ